jgi:hypothetical protein
MNSKMAFMHRSRRRGIAAIAIAVVALMVAPVTLLAQDVSPAPDGGSVAVTEPVVVLSIGSIDKLMQDINYMSRVLGKEQAGMMFSMMAGGFTQGIDLTQPMAIIVPLVDQTPQPMALVPTADVKTVLKRLEAQTGPADELDDGTLVIAVGASTVFIRQLGNWAVLARQRDLLDLAPPDPTTIFEGLGNDYDLSVRLRLQEVPAATRSMLITQIRQGFEQAMAQQNNPDAESAREMAETQLDQLEMMLDQTDEIVFGINVDEAGQLVAVEGSMSAVPGSEMASIYGGQRAIPSRFSSVIRDDAAAFYHASTSIAPAAVKQTRAALDTYLTAMDNALAGEDSLSSEQKADLSTMLKRIADLAMASIEEGKADVGALLLADPNDFRFVFGSFVSDGNEAAKIVKELAAKVKSEPNAPRFKFDQDTYKGITMHLVEADVPADQDEARRVFGDTLRVHIGTGDKVVFAAVGNESEALMKQLIDAGESDNVGDRPVGQMKISLLPILQYAQSIEANDTLAAMIDAISRSPDAGELIVVSHAIENGGKSRITIGEGLLQAIGAAIRENQPVPAGQF